MHTTTMCPMLSVSQMNSQRGAKYKLLENAFGLCTQMVLEGFEFKKLNGQ